MTDPVAPESKASETTPTEKANADTTFPKITAVRPDIRILQSLRRIIRAVDIHSRKLKSEHDITGPQLFCLHAIIDGGPLTATAIGKMVHLSPSTVIGILDRLEEKGLIHRQRDSKDRRLVNVTATEQGVEAVRNAPSPLQDSLGESLKRLPQLEQSTIALSLERVVELMEVGHIDAAPILEAGPIDSAGKKSTANEPAELDELEDLARKLKDALASNTMTGSKPREKKLDWRAASDEVRRLKANWQRAAPVPGDEGRALVERFQNACERFSEQKPK